MGVEVHRSVSSFVTTCNEKVCRVTKKLKNYCSDNHKYRVSNDFIIHQCETLRRAPPTGSFRKAAGLIPFLVKGRSSRSRSEYDDDDGDGHNDRAIWRKTILMGEKCEPLDYSGVIYYDNKGRLLEHAPPRTPRRSILGFSPLPSFLLSAATPEKYPKHGGAGDAHHLP